MDPADQQGQVNELPAGLPYPSVYHHTSEPLGHLSHQFQPRPSFAPPTVNQYSLAPPFPYPQLTAQSFTTLADIPTYRPSATGIPIYPYPYPPIQSAAYTPHSASIGHSANNASAYLLDQPAPHATGNSPVDLTWLSATQWPTRAYPHQALEPSTQTIYSATPRRPMAETSVNPDQSAPHAVPNEFFMDSTEPSAYDPPPRRRNQQGSQRTRAKGGIFRGAHHFVVNGPIMNDSNPFDDFMKEFAKDTILGAAFDSSARDPPPRCHPGTRLAILQRMQDFIVDRMQHKRMLWLVGPAGVGKSAIMQTFAENASRIAPDLVLGASLFFSINGRNDGSKTISTLAYQLAVSNSPYRQFIQNEVVNDPLLLQKSMTAQFNKLIVEPFVHHAINPHGKRFLILIDGLDECNDEHTQGRHTQRTILGLISYFSTTYPTAPLVWIVASRPEPHIASFLSLRRVVPSYNKEEIIIDSDEAREDVERYLRDELDKLREKYPALMSRAQWPAEHDFLKLAAAANGLFAYAFTAVRYIDDPIYANPASQLKLVLEVIDNVPSIRKEGNVHPMANLDALYSRILSQIPRNILPETKKLLLFMGLEYYLPFVTLCDWLGMTRDVAYSALHHLHSVLRIPSPEEAFSLHLAVRHKSFRDYLYDFNRSGMFPDISCERNDIISQCLKRIFDEVSKAGIGASSNPSACISLPWEFQGCQGLGEDLEILFDRRDAVYHHAMDFLAEYLFYGSPNMFESSDYIRFLKLLDLRRCLDTISYVSLSGQIFDERKYSRLKDYCVVDMIPIGKLDMDNIVEEKKFVVRYWTQNPAVEDPPDVGWCDSCSGRDLWEYNEDMMAGQGEQWEYTIFSPCKCVVHILQVIEYGQTHTPDHLVTIYPDIRNFGWINYKFVDGEDELSQWSYVIPYQFPSATRV